MVIDAAVIDVMMTQTKQATPKIQMIHTIPTIPVAKYRMVPRNPGSTVKACSNVISASISTVWREINQLIWGWIEWMFCIVCSLLIILLAWHWSIGHGIWYTNDVGDLRDEAKPKPSDATLSVFPIYWTLNPHMKCTPPSHCVCLRPQVRLAHNINDFCHLNKLFREYILGAALLGLSQDCQI